jgi:hypothetical protein
VKHFKLNLLAQTAAFKKTGATARVNDCGVISVEYYAYMDNILVGEWYMG